MLKFTSHRFTPRYKSNFPERGDRIPRVSRRIRMVSVRSGTRSGQHLIWNEEARR